MTVSIGLLSLVLDIIARAETARASTTMSTSMPAPPKLPLHKLPNHPSFNLRFSAHLIPANRLRFASQCRLSSSPSLRSDLVEHEHASQSSFSSLYTCSVASPPSFFRLSPSSFSHRHILLLNLTACLAAVSATWLFFSAIPALLAFKKAAESLEKLMDVTRKELPDTMAAIRLSGMEISDLTGELSDLGQEITQGVRSSTRAVRVAEERLRQFTNMPPSASLQNVTIQKSKAGEPIVATTAREMREGIGKARALIKMLMSFSRFSRMAFNYFTSRAK